MLIPVNKRARLLQQPPARQQKRNVIRGGGIGVLHGAVLAAYAILAYYVALALTRRRLLK